MTDNPYSTPTLDLEASSVAAPTEPTPTLDSIAKSTFLAWERLRVVFILVLGIPTLLLAGPNLLRFQTIVLIAEGAIVANIAYFAGPCVETYVRWLGYNGKWVRWFLFLAGTMLTAILAIATVLPHLEVEFLRD